MEKKNLGFGIRRIMVVVLVAVLLLSLTTGCMRQNGDTDKKALLVVSFGSSFIDNRAASIDMIEKDLAEHFSDYDFYNAYTSQIIIDIYQGRDKIEIDNVSQAIEKIYKAGYGEVLIVPTLVINGEEYDEILEATAPFKDLFAKMTISTALLSSYDDYISVINALDAEMPETGEKEAIVFMGHGTHHHANSAYGTLDYIFKDEGYDNVYIGTVEGFPTFDTVLKKVKENGYEKVTLMPMMAVAGDHAHNDMAGDEGDSWINLFKLQGLDVDYIMQGLGELPSIRAQFISHAEAALADQ